MKAPVWVPKSSPTPPPLYSHFTPFLLGRYLDSHLYIEESERRCPRGTREVTLKAAEGFQSMVFHQKSSQTVHSKSLFLGQEEEQTGPLWGSEKEQCHLSCLQGLFRVQPRADQGQSHLPSPLLSVFLKLLYNKNHLDAGGEWAYTHSQAPPSEILIWRVWGGALETVFNKCPLFIRQVGEFLWNLGIFGPKTTSSRKLPDGPF